MTRRIRRKFGFNFNLLMDPIFGIAVWKIVAS
jgi:hypothetical protein